MSGNICDICNGRAVGVTSSVLGAISFAICEDCATSNRQPWAVLVGGLYGTSKENVGDWVKPIIEETCAFYKKTEDELWAEVKRLEEDFENFTKQADLER